MRPLLEDERTQREIKKAALIYFENGEKQNALDKIKEYDGDGMNITLLVMKCKLFYSLEQFSECQELAEEIIGEFNFLTHDFPCSCFAYFDVDFRTIKDALLPFYVVLYLILFLLSSLSILSYFLCSIIFTSSQNKMITTYPCTVSISYHIISYY